MRAGERACERACERAASIRLNGAGSHEKNYSASSPDGQLLVGTAQDAALIHMIELNRPRGLLAGGPSSLVNWRR